MKVDRSILGAGISFAGTSQRQPKAHFDRSYGAPKMLDPIGAVLKEAKRRNPFWGSQC